MRGAGKRADLEVMFRANVSHHPTRYHTAKQRSSLRETTSIQRIYVVTLIGHEFFFCRTNRLRTQHLCTRNSQMIRAEPVHSLLSDKTFLVPVKLG